MQAFVRPLQELQEYENLIRKVKTFSGVTSVAGCTDAQKPHLIYGINHGCGKIVVTFSEQKARELVEEYRFFDPNVVYYPPRDVLFYQSDIRGNALTKERMEAYRTIFTQEHPTIITTMDACMDRLIHPEVVKASVLTIRVGDELDLAKMRRKLAAMGYEYNYQAELPGQFAVRGGILDVFSLTEEVPFRVELWGDEVDSLRSFDWESQRSIENLDEISIYPASELMMADEVRKSGIARIQKEYEQIYDRFRKEMKTEEAYRLKESVSYVLEQLKEGCGLQAAESFLTYFYKDTVNLFSYFGDRPYMIFMDEPGRCVEKADSVEAEYRMSMEQRLEKGYILPGQADVLFSGKHILAKAGAQNLVLLSALGTRVDGLTPEATYQIPAASVNAYNGSFEMLLKDLHRYKKNGYRVILVAPSRLRANRFASDLQQEDLNCFYTDDKDHELKPGEVMVVSGNMKRGYEYPLLKFVVLTQSDIFGTEKKKKKRRKLYEGEKIRSFNDLSIGDYVVHENHGLGIYRGIEKVDVDRVTKDYIKIEYARGGNLYILATQLDMLQKYAGADAKKPKLNRLGGQEWQKTKTKVRGAVKEIARDLVELYAARQNKDGFVYGADTVWQREFEEMFPYEETEDQLAAIEAVKHDMESRKIMDRLVCGDVGFGKTEVAIRAAFKAVQEGKQVVYLVPTTILAQQHYNTFVQRMKEFPVRVDLLCRFRTSKEQKQTITDLKKGMVDIVIGTHRVLSKDVQYKDLGLLIIDEEQRFGVAHKEKIKQMKNTVDVLTLTATPIPRTLHMSLIGIRDMSLLEEAPKNRMPIQTYVMEHNDEMVREAINRELARGGQVYYVFNRVNQIVEVTAHLSELLPEAVIEFAHGQMKERELEDIMYRFINGEIDVLVSTTIIETGLDISNANTMIIHDADNMGLSQLYQLRGRIGRSNRTAYAFLMYRRNKMLREVAEKRLAAIREFSELGSGIKIAMKDLEIRGAGNLLGADQHGHMEAVGYDLYCKMLGEAVKEEKGEMPEEAFDTLIDVDIDAYIPGTYIANEYQKLDIYKRIAGIGNEAESDEMLEELIDRFGEPPKPVQNLLLIARLKGEAHRAFFTEVSQKGETVKFLFYSKARINAAKIPEFVDSYGGDLTFMPDKEAPGFLWQQKAVKNKKNQDTLEMIARIIQEVQKCLCENNMKAVAADRKKSYNESV